jgi:phosphatidyl-myo-inositol alpha-mannosyltransferase
MKIGLVCPYNIGLGGGVQECVGAMQKELKKRGHTVYIVTPNSREARENLPPKDTILVGSGTEFRSPFSTTAQVSASFNPDDLERITEKYQFDILHFHEPWVPMLSRQLLSKSKSINVATFHARMPDNIMSKTIEKVITPYTKSILGSFDSFTAVSDAAAQYVRSITDHPIEIIPNGIDLRKYKAKRNREQIGKRTILFIGRLERRKGVNFLIDAFARLNDPDCELLIAGNGPDRGKLEAQARSKNLGNVYFLGYVSDKEKVELLREASVFSSPAIYGESFGIVLLEAMACGVPIVAANNPGYAAVMKGRGLVSLVNPQDTEQFARRLALMLYDEELAQLWRKWALKNVRQYGYPTVVDQYEALYKKLLKK